MKKARKALSLMLCILMLLSAVPLGAAAADNAWDGTVDISWYDSEKSEFYLSTPAQLAGLAALVNGMADPTCPKIIGDESLLVSVRHDDVMLVGAGGGNVSDTVYTSNIDFAYKTIYLTADMDMGGKMDASGKWSGPNWTPIGGKFPMLPDEAVGDCLTLDTRFNGVFDGQGHTVKNIYCERYAAKGFPYSMAVGLIGFLGGSSDIGLMSDQTFSLDGWTPACRNVVVGDGYIRGRRMIGGVVGRSDSAVIIENCANMADIYNTDAKGIGGIVGSCWGGGVVRNCYNSGNITTSYTDCPAGGIVGSNESTSIYNCYNVGKISGLRARDIGSHDSGVYTVDNCYFLEGMSDDASANGYYKGTSKRITVNVTSMTSAEMKSSTLLNALNANGNIFVADTKGINNGYPILWFQAAAGGSSGKVTVKQPSNGTVSVSAAEAEFGSVVSFSCTPEAGYTLDTYTVNGQKINSDFYTVTGDIEVSAVFKLLGYGTITIPTSLDYYVAVSREGVKTENGEMLYVFDDMLTTGDTVYEGNKLKVMVYGYGDAVNADMDLEYIDAFSYTMPDCIKNSDGTYTYGGHQDLVIGVNRTAQNKQWVNYADTAWYTSSAKSTKYTITTPQQLAGLAYLVNKSGVTFEGITISLGNDISLTNTDGTTGSRYWTPIGSNANKAFKGSFAGCGYSVYDMAVMSSSSYAGLFGVCSGASIRDLSVYGSSQSSANSSYAGGLAASMDNCKVEKVFIYADVTATGNYAGGIAAAITGGTTISDSMFSGNVKGASGIGGITGLSENGSDRIENCASFGTITSTGNATYGTGGIAGKLNGKIISSASYCDISGTDRYTGGIAGYCCGKNTTEISDCAFYGKASSTNTTANAATGGMAGYGQFLTLKGGSIKDSSLSEVGREGTVKLVSSTASAPEYEMPAAKSFTGTHSAPYTITFIAEGKVIATETYSAISDTVKEPAVPAKDGNTGYWQPYTLGNKDITVNAIYRQKLVRGGESITKSGTYYIAWFSSGEIKVADGISVKLIGDNGPFSSLAITTGEKVHLTLSDLSITSESTMLTLGKDSTLTLEGKSSLISKTEKGRNEAVAMVVLGNLVIDGTGEILCNAAKRNTSVYVKNEGSVVELRSGTLSTTKDTLLGFEGGAFYAPGSELKITGGTFRSFTDDDNIRCIYADKVTMSAGNLFVESIKSPVSIEAKVTTTGGTIMAYGHTGNNAEANQQEFRGLTSVTSYSGNAQKKELPPFTDVHVTDSYYDDVVFCYENGLFAGTGGALFQPDSAMTRSMFVMVLYKLAGSPAVTRTDVFKDLTQDWYKDAVAWAVKNGITSGTSASTFSPSTPVSRQQAATFMVNYASFAKASLPTDRGQDVFCGQVAQWAYGPVNTVISAGLLDGIDDAMTNPADFAPRSMLATVLANYCRVTK